MRHVLQETASAIALGRPKQQTAEGLGGARLPRTCAQKQQGGAAGLSPRAAGLLEKSGRLLEGPTTLLDGGQPVGRPLQMPCVRSWSEGESGPICPCADRSQRLLRAVRQGRACLGRRVLSEATVHVYYWGWNSRATNPNWSSLTQRFVHQKKSSSCYTCA